VRSAERGALIRVAILVVLAAAIVAFMLWINAQVT
jgi:hypothetical protein